MKLQLDIICTEVIQEAMQEDDRAPRQEKGSQHKALGYPNKEAVTL